MIKLGQLPYSEIASDIPLRFILPRLRSKMIGVPHVFERSLFVFS